MPRNSVQEQIEQAVALIPANGEIEYTAWQEAMRSAGLHAAVQKGWAMRKFGVAFRTEVTPTSKKLFVRRGE